MKTLLLSSARTLMAGLLLLLLALPRTVVAQGVPTEKDKALPSSGSPAKFEITWTHPATPELQIAKNDLAHSEKVFRLGGMTEEDLIVRRYQAAAIERRAPLLLSIQSRGGSLREFIAAASSSEEVSLSLFNAGDPGDLETQLPAFNLQNANWGTVIEVLSNFLATRGLQLRHAGGDNPNPSEARSVVCVLRRVEAPIAEKRVVPTVFESFPVGQYLSEQSIDEIVGAIRAGWELDPAHDKDALKLKFHQPTAILLVSGPPEATFITGKIISQLKGKFDKDSKNNLKSREQNSPSDKK
jgi:hypothetical protein